MVIQKEKTLPILKKSASVYKLTVPANVEEKIRYLLRKFPHTEWSGVLFYTHEGSFENNDLHIICKDIYPMDLGDATFTSFSMSEDVAAYMADNLELFDCDTGLVHSHHSMSANFSGTDTSTLAKEGNDTNCFVSLIVNNEGTYCAAVTRKVQHKTEITKRSLGMSYEFFGEGRISEGEKPVAEITEVLEDEFIEYSMLDVTREVVDNPLSYLDDRFNEIKSKKTEERKPWYSKYDPLPVKRQGDVKKPNVYDSYFEGLSGSDFDLDKSNKEPSLFDNWNWYKETNKFSFDSGSDYVPNKKLIDKAATAIVTCSLLHLTEKAGKFDLGKFIKNDMDKLYKDIFPENNGYGLSAFSQWCEFIVDWIITNFNDPKAPKGKDVWTENEKLSAVAEALVEKLQKYRDNSWIESYCGYLETFIEQ